MRHDEQMVGSCIQFVESSDMDMPTLEKLNGWMDSTGVRLMDGELGFYINLVILATKRMALRREQRNEKRAVRL